MRTLYPSKLFFKSDFLNNTVYSRIGGFEKSLKGVISVALLACGTTLLDVPNSEQSRIVQSSSSFSPIVPVKVDEAKPVADFQESSIRMGIDRSLSRALRQSGIRQDVIVAISRCLSIKMVRSFRPNQVVRMAFESGVLSSVKVYTHAGRALLIRRNVDGVWSSARISSPVVVKYERLKLPVTHTLKKALLSAGLDRALTWDIARGLARSGVMWGNLKGATVELMVQTRRCSETGALVLDHIAVIQVVKNGHKKTYYAYQRGPSDSRRIFCTLASFGLQSGNAARSIMWCPPVSKGKVTSGFGKRLHPIYKRIKHHNGTDYSGSHGSPIRAVGDGFVKSVSQNGSYGKYVTIAHSNGYRTLYAHLSRTMVRTGQRVRTGQTIGGMGSTGTATGTHLHLEVLDRSSRPINPEYFLKSIKKQTKSGASRSEFSGKQKVNFYKQARVLALKYAALGGSVSSPLFACGNSKKTSQKKLLKKHSNSIRGAVPAGRIRQSCSKKTKKN